MYDKKKAGSMPGRINKRLFALLLVLGMAVMVPAGCGSKNAAVSRNEVKLENGYQYVSPEAAVDAAKSEDIHVVDVREWDKYAEGRLEGSLWNPIFPLDDESLTEHMTEFTKNQLMDGKKIYLVCNSGKRGAEKATSVMKAAGVDEKLIFTVEGGAKSLADIKGALSTERVGEPIAWQYVEGDAAVKAAGDGSAQIVDVRDAESFGKGHLANSLTVSLKDFADAKAQTEAFHLAESMDKDKPVYFVCYSGNKCAKTAISVFKDAGFDVNKLYIVKDGAKNEAVSAAFVQ